MNHNVTQQQLQKLRLPAMASYYEQVLKLPIHEQPEAHELLAQLTERELLHRSNRKTELLLRSSKLRQRCMISNITYEPERKLNKQVVHQLAEGNYILKGENIIITGATGCGKSYLACAFAHQACQQGHSVLYVNMNNLADKMNIAKLDGSYPKFYKQLVQPKILIVDDFGLAPLLYEVKLALLQIMEERYELKSIIVIAQLPVAHWYDYINDPTIADAILDRLTAKAHRIELKGPSKRIKIKQ
jgi:DNA replication protein DnaC